MSIRKENKTLSDADYVANCWFERGEGYVCLEMPDGKEIFLLRNEDLEQAVEDGFLTTPRVPRPRDSDWQPHLVAYARYYGLIK